ncbi:MAG: glycogen debranching protein GlgX [Deltaproteobacteria bacterium]|nr:glycogen debranching protein GlgX [Deltaproteobacteria bacterium]
MAEVTAGEWTRLGPTLRDGGVNFAVFAPRAERVDVCLFAHDGAETARLALPTRHDGVHCGFVAGLEAGQLYGLRASGPWRPADALLFNPQKLLLDPYSPRVVGEVNWHPSVRGGRRDWPDEPEPTDSASAVPRGAVVDHAFDWGSDRPLRTPWAETFVYEAHVGGMTATHPAVPTGQRGTYLGLGHPAVVEHLLALGVTAVELLPVHARVSEESLVERGLSNYWGYGTLGFFAPDPRFATAPGREVREFKEMVRALHAAGIEVLLDVVYNHTIEGDSNGPHLSLRGLANRTYYRHEEHAPEKQVDWTGCGNTLDPSRDAGLRLVLDSLRSWVSDYHVDGFRFDLAPALFRDRHGVFSGDGRFAAALFQDPVLRGTKLIAEPWDLGPSGYRLGDFPHPFREWNDRFRDTARRFWRGDAGQLPEIASRIGGSSDLFGGADEGLGRPRGPLASVNYVACHDGFTLADLVSYERKRNLANGEDGRDGSNSNWSCPWGPEGPTGEPGILATRGTVARSLLATSLLSLGVPMIGHGDELGRTQRGNNNAYCHDSPLSWIDWESADRSLIDFVGHVAALRRGHPLIAQGRFLRHQEARWLRPDGLELQVEDWEDPQARTLGLFVAEENEACCLLLLNGSDAPVSFLIPGSGVSNWQIKLDTSRPVLRSEHVVCDRVELVPHALLFLQTIDGRSTAAPLSR